MVLFADDRSVIVTDTNKLRFNANLLTLNFNKTQYVKFRSMNYYAITTQINYDQINLPNVTQIKFLGLITDDTLSWKQHIEHVINKISIVCYAMRNIK